MEEDDGSNRYSATNEIIDHDGAADVGIFEPPNSDVNWSNAVQGQGGGRGESDVGISSCNNLVVDCSNGGQSNIYKNTITATKGQSDVGISSFNNLVVDCSNGGHGQGSREFEGICHNIDCNEITADNRSKKVGFENFGNVNYNCKTTSTKDHGKAAGGSSSAQGQGGGGGKKPEGDGLNIHRNNIEGDRVPKAYHNFSNFECNLKTTNTEDDGNTNKSNISKNKITARYGSSYVGMFNFHNVYVNAGQGQGGCEGNESFFKHKGIGHNIHNNTIIAVKSRKVGLQNFGNIKYNCQPTIISQLLQFLGLSY